MRWGGVGWVTSYIDDLSGASEDEEGLHLGEAAFGADGLGPDELVQLLELIVETRLQIAGGNVCGDHHLLHFRLCRGIRKALRVVARGTVFVFSSSQWRVQARR